MKNLNLDEYVYTLTFKKHKKLGTNLWFLLSNFFQYLVWYLFLYILHPSLTSNIDKAQNKPNKIH